MAEGYRLGIDVGGTFTDGILIEEATGHIRSVKVPSTPRDPSEGFLASLDAMLRQFGVDPDQVWLLVHGTTVATNAIIEGKTAPTALVVTRGFRDILEIAYQIRPKLYDVFVEKPPPLVQRDCCFEVTERIGPDGEVLCPLAEDEVRQVADGIAAKGIEAVAVCFLHSYVNSAHEQRAGEILAEVLPEAGVTLSSVISPEFREYPRASTAAVNACIRPIVSRYVDKIEAGLAQRGLGCGCYLMQSNGGIVSSEVSKAEPARITESGPAAGIIISTHIATQTGRDQALCIDIGGTTAKVGIVLDGQPRISRELEVGAAAFSRSTARRASGYPLRMPSIDLVEIGAGGGSIAWVDSGGILRVGPHSAGADPGPACYSDGGEAPTLTDANLILGRLNPDFFLGGEMKLERARAVAALETHCSKQLGTDVVQTAAGVVRVAVANMVNAIRFLSVEKGYDPRDFSLITTGGAGPLHANLLADELGIPTVIVPPRPGVASALGLVISDLKQELATTVLTLKGLDGTKVRKIFGDLAEQVTARLREQAAAGQELQLAPSADVRYAGQSYELNVQLEAQLWQQIDLGGIATVFHGEHRRAYGFANEGDPVEVVNLRMTGVAAMPAYRDRRVAAGAAEPPAEAARPSRAVCFDESGQLSDCRVYDRSRLLHGNVVSGPAIVEEVVATTVVLPGYEAAVDEYGNLVISRMATQ